MAGERFAKRSCEQLLGPVLKLSTPTTGRQHFPVHSPGQRNKTCSRRAPTSPQAVLLDQMNGALRGEIEAIILQLGAASDLSQARNALVQLLERADAGIRMVDGWRIVFAGPPNAGKSSLINANRGTRSLDCS